MNERNKIFICMPRGDIRLVRFIVHDPSGDISQIDFTEIYFSVKRSVYEKELLFQKRLSNGDIVKLDAGDYQLRIDPEDTNGLDFNKYVCDIQLDYNDEIKQTICGTLQITDEVTYAGNEDGTP